MSQIPSLHDRNRKISFYEFKLVPPDVERQDRSDIKTARGAARLAGLDADWHRPNDSEI